MTYLELLPILLESNAIPSYRFARNGAMWTLEIGIDSAPVYTRATAQTMERAARVALCEYHHDLRMYADLAAASLQAFMMTWCNPPGPRGDKHVLSLVPPGKTSTTDGGDTLEAMDHEAIVEAASRSSTVQQAHRMADEAFEPIDSPPCGPQG